MTLLDLQRDFRSRLLDEEIIAPGMPDGFEVYQHAYRAQLIQVLRETFERVWSWIGDDTFDAVAHAYIDQAPPTSWTLGEYGAGFAEIVANIFPEDREVVELAQLDWAMRRAFDGPDAPPLDALALAALDWEAVRIRFVPTLVLLRFETNAAAIWSALAESTHVPAAEWLGAPKTVRVWRAEEQPRFLTMDLDEAGAVLAVYDRTTFAGLCDFLAKEHGVAIAIDLASTLLGSWLADGLIAQVSS